PGGSFSLGTHSGLFFQLACFLRGPCGRFAFLLGTEIGFLALTQFTLTTLVTLARKAFFIAENRRTHHRLSTLNPGIGLSCLASHLILGALASLGATFPGSGGTGGRRSGLPGFLHHRRHRRLLDRLRLSH